MREDSKDDDQEGYLMEKGEGGRGCGTGLERDSGEVQYERQLACSGAGGLLS